MKELKKKYIKPEIMSYKLKSTQHLLAGSQKREIPNDDEDNEGWFN